MNSETPQHKLSIAGHLFGLFIAAGMLLWLPWMIKSEAPQEIPFTPPTKSPNQYTDENEIKEQVDTVEDERSVEVEENETARNDINASVDITPEPTANQAAFSPLADKQTTAFMITDANGAHIGWESRYVSPIANDLALRAAENLGIPIYASINALLGLDPAKSFIDHNYADPSVMRFKGENQRRIDLNGVTRQLSIFYVQTELGEHLVFDIDMSTFYTRMYSPTLSVWQPQLSADQMPISERGIAINMAPALDVTQTMNFLAIPSVDNQIDQLEKQEIPADWSPYQPCRVIKQKRFIENTSEYAYAHQTFCSEIGLVLEERFTDNNQLIETLTLVSTNIRDLKQSPIKHWENDFSPPAITSTAKTELDISDWQLTAWGRFHPSEEHLSLIHPLLFLNTEQPVLISAYTQNPLTALYADIPETFAWDIAPLGDVFGPAALNPQNGLIYFADSENTLYAMNQYGMFFDSFATGNNNILTKAAFGENTVWFGSEEGNIYCIGADLDPATAKTLNTGTPVAASPVKWDNTAIFGTDSGMLVAVNTACETVWEYTAGDLIDAPLAIDEAGVIYFAGYGQIGAVDAATGEMIWQRDLQVPLHHQATIGPDAIYVVDQFNILHAYRRSDGQLRWSNGDHTFIASPIVLNNQLLVNSQSADILLIDLDGNIQANWLREKPPNVTEDFEDTDLIFAPVWGNGAVWTIDSKGYLYRFGPPIQPPQ